MHDRSVRRRRAILALLVGLSLILLTATFGDNVGGPLRSIQRGMLEVLAPIQEGANRVLKPFRDLAGWAGDTLDAKDERDKMRDERNSLRRQVVSLQQAQRENVQLRRLVGLDRQRDLERQDPVTARVIGRSPNLWYTTINVDKGSSAGVRRDQPVVNGEGLVGKVTEVTTGASVVTLITDHTSGVSARVLGGRGDEGIVQTAVGNPNDLLLEFLPRDSQVRRGERIVTAGTRSNRLESLFPPGIPVGSVTKVDPDEIDVYQRVHIKPYADLRRLDFVQILTDPDRDKAAVVSSGAGAGQARAQVP